MAADLDAYCGQNHFSGTKVEFRRQLRFNLLLTFFLLGLLACAVFLPIYLRYADKPVKSDVVVLFVGDDWAARRREAAKLVTDGYARRLIIPAYNRWDDMKTTGMPVPIDHNYLPGNSVSLLKGQFKYRRYFEDTHFEVLEARRIMTKYGFESAIFVSSPYHMRRIKLITETVFKEKTKLISFIPTRFEKAHGSSLEQTVWHVRWIIGEFAKIAWFKIYSLGLHDSRRSNQFSSGRAHTG